MWSDVLPLAIAMMAGPQIISALVFITTKEPVKISLAYIGGITIATTAGVYATFLLFKTVLSGLNISGSSSGLGILEVVLVAVLAFLAIDSFLDRKSSKPPEWLAKLSSTSPRRAFRLGWLLIWLMPSDIIIMLTTGLHLARSQEGFVSVIPFIALVTLVASLPLLSFLVFHKQMVKAMPAINTWIEGNGWLINIFVYVLFIFIIL